MAINNNGTNTLIRNKYNIIPAQIHRFDLALLETSLFILLVVNWRRGLQREEHLKSNNNIKKLVVDLQFECGLLSKGKQCVHCWMNCVPNPVRSSLKFSAYTHIIINVTLRTIHLYLF